jgi:hypothetical protein
VESPSSTAAADSVGPPTAMTRSPPPPLTGRLLGTRWEGARQLSPPLRTHVCPCQSSPQRAAKRFPERSYPAVRTRLSLRASGADYGADVEGPGGAYQRSPLGYLRGSLRASDSDASESSTATGAPDTAPAVIPAFSGKSSPRRLDKGAGNCVFSCFEHPGPPAAGSSGARKDSTPPWRCVRRSFGVASRSTAPSLERER